MKHHNFDENNIPVIEGQRFYIDMLSIHKYAEEQIRMLDNPLVSRCSNCYSTIKIGYECDECKDIIK